MCQYNNNSVFTKERLISLMDVPTPYKGLTTLKAKIVRLALDLRFKHLDTFTKREIKTCSSYFSKIALVLSL
jgi:hypothetical protein